MSKQLASAFLTGLTYLIALLMFFPIAWMALTSFKPEVVAFSLPPRLFFAPTLENYLDAIFRANVFRSNYFFFFRNTVLAVGLSTALAFLLGIPAAYSLTFHQRRSNTNILMWILSTKMMPPVGIIIPLFVIYRDLRLLDSVAGLSLVYAMMNVSLVIWMMRSFFADLPADIIEAGRVDGTSAFQEMWHLALPLVRPGLVATALLCMIFAWNEFFFALNLTAAQATPLSVYISGFKTSEGLFWAKMSAAATATVLPVLIAGWVAQRQLIRGLTMGAVK